MGWDFTAKETLSQGNIYTSGVDTLSLNGSNVQLQSCDSNNSIQPFNWTSISFLGTKLTTPVPGFPYKVGNVLNL